MRRTRIPRTVLLGAFALTLMAMAGSGAPELIRHDDFEADAPDSFPSGWFSRRSLSEGYRIVASPQAARVGRQGLVLEMAKDPPNWNSYGAASARFDARGLRGRRVRLMGWGRFHQTTANDGRGHFWMRIDRHGDGAGAYDDTPNHPVTSADWQPGTIVLNVDTDADTLVYGVLMRGHGRFDVDDITLTVLGPAGEGDGPPRKISERGVENLVAFGRLAGVVRYFHPSDEAASLDWNAFMIDHIDEVERAGSTDQLVASLRAVFAPIAPAVKIDRKPLGAMASLPELGSTGAAPESLVGWVHHGFGGTSLMSPYRSERLTRPPGAASELLPLGAAWAGPLGGGLYARVPLTLARTIHGTLPRPTLASLMRATRRPNDWTPSGTDRATRLADVLIASGILAHFYPYADVVRLDLPLAIGEALRSAATATDSEFTATLGRLSAHLRDGHGYVTGPRQPSKWLPLAFEFVGDDLTVVGVRKDSDGAHVGDVVVAIDGRPAERVLAERRRLLSASTEGHLRVRLGDVMAISDAPRTLTLRGVDGVTRVKRFEPGFGAVVRPARPDSIAEPKPGIHYVDLDRITDADWAREAERFSKGKGLIFDLRGYPSHVSAIPIAHLVTDSVWTARWNIPVLQKPFMADVKWDTTGRWSIAPREPHIGVPVAFLVNGRAVSYAETWMGIIEAYHLGTIIGEPTAGTNGNICSIALPGGYSMTFTGMKVLKHDRSRHHGVGIHPTVPVSRTLAGLAAGRDEALERAIEVVSRGP